MKKEELKKVIISQSKIKEEKNIQREQYSILKKNLENNLIVIISGIRRCGKSTLLNQLRKELKQNNYFINFDDNRLIDFNFEDFEKLYEAFLELYGEEDIFYFDEIQLIKGWERFIRRLHNDGKKVIITGSNASMLSKEMGTHLTGRHIEISLFPFSFREFIKFYDFRYSKNDLYDIKIITKIKKFFKDYLNYGGIPEFLKLKDEKYLSTLYDNIFYRDVMTRYNLSNEKILKELIFFLVSNVGTKVSHFSIKNLLNIGSSTTVKEYINYFENTFLIFNINKFDYSLKKQILNPKKIYLIDNGFASQISFKFSENIGRLLENLIFLELKRQNKEIFYHFNKKECDFLIFDRGKIVQVIQVTQSLEDIDTKKREIDGLIDACKSYNLKEGLILTEDEEGEFIQDNIKIIIKPIWKWLLVEN